MRETYDKLVRDGIPEMIRADGDEPVTHVVEGDDYRERLHDKLDEEVAEFHESGDPEELADVLAVVDALAEACGSSESELTEIRRAKAAERGEFAEGIVLHAVRRGSGLAEVKGGSPRANDVSAPGSIDGDMGDSPLDVIDQAILYHLQQDGRRPVTDIADALDVSDNTVRNRMEAMEESGVISGYRVTVNYDAADVQHYYVFVCSVRVRDREPLADEARKLDGVVEVITLMTGTHNVLVIGAGQGKDDMTDLAYDIDDLGLAVEREHLIREHERQAYSGFAPPDPVGE